MFAWLDSTFPAGFTWWQTLLAGVVLGVLFLLIFGTRWMVRLSAAMKYLGDKGEEHVAKRQ